MDFTRGADLKDALVQHFHDRTLPAESGPQVELFRDGVGRSLHHAPRMQMIGFPGDGNIEDACKRAVFVADGGCGAAPDMMPGAIVLCADDGHGLLFDKASPDAVGAGYGFRGDLAGKHVGPVALTPQGVQYEP